MSRIFAFTAILWIWILILSALCGEISDCRHALVMMTLSIIGAKVFEKPIKEPPQ